MRKSLLYITGFCCLNLAVHVAGFGQDGQKTYQLLNKFSQDEAVLLEMTTTINGIATTKTAKQPAQHPMKYQLDSEMIFQTLSTSPDGKANLEIQFEKMVTSGESMGSATQDLVETLHLKEQPVRIQVSPLGEVKELSGQTETKTGVQKSVKSVTRQMPYLKVPAQPIPAGFSWNEDQQVPFSAAAKPFIAHTTYTLKEVVEEDGEQIAVIESTMYLHETDVPVDTNTKMGENQNVILKFFFKEYSIVGTGEIRFSLNKGRILTSSTRQNIKDHRQGSTDINKASFEQDVLQESVQETKAVFSVKPPEESADSSKSETQ